MSGELAGRVGVRLGCANFVEILDEGSAAPNSNISGLHGDDGKPSGAGEPFFAGSNCIWLCRGAGLAPHWQPHGRLLPVRDEHSPVTALQSLHGPHGADHYRGLMGVMRPALLQAAASLGVQGLPGVDGAGRRQAGV